MSETDRDKVFELVKHFDTGMLLTFGENPAETHIRPMAVAQVEKTLQLWFLSGAQSLKVQDLERDPRAQVVFQTGSAFAVMTGAAIVNRDRAKLDELWKEPYKVWFPQGKEDPNLVLVSFTPNDAEYWDNSGTNKIKYLFEAARAYVKGVEAKTDPDQHKKVKL